MDWHYLGHASWLVEAGGLRVLFDPLLADLHHGDVFEVEPAREIDANALRPDFLVVSHRHADHFDIPSLARLARLDPDTVVFTADPLVERAARAVGFRTVAKVETFSRIDLDGIRLASTPSHIEEIEWGMIVESSEGVCWNQIDSYHPDGAAVVETLVKASTIFERDLTRNLPLALVRWQPVLEMNAVQADSPGFPFREYAEALGRIAAIDARAVVPSAAGVRHAQPYAFMNHYVYPVPQRRVLRDLAARAPSTRAFPAVTGATYRVRGGEPSFDATGARDFVRVLPGDAGSMTTMFRPYEMPAVRDPNRFGRDVSAMRATCEQWIRGALANGLAQAYPTMNVRTPLRFVMEVVFEAVTDAFTIAVDARGARVERVLDDDYDAITTIAGSLLADVIDGRRGWGDPMLSGHMRCALRAYDLDVSGLLVARIPVTWVFFGLSYDESVERAVEWEIERLSPGPSPQTERGG